MDFQRARAEAIDVEAVQSPEGSKPVDPLKIVVPPQSMASGLSPSERLALADELRRRARLAGAAAQEHAAAAQSLLELARQRLQRNAQTR